ncbi:MAG: cyclic nucleotide-binding domain-containing protein [Desulfamplus sp.]|nr:cyclic nucleotide-binding domain-containing protein [Desulfamplus sp.]
MVPIDQLKKIEFLHDLPDNILDKIAPVARLENFEAGAVLINQNKEQQTIYMLTTGKIFLNSISPLTAKVLTLEYIMPGQSFGLSTLLGKANSTFTAVCQEPCEVITLSGNEMNQLFLSDFTVGYAVMLRVAGILKDRMKKHTTNFIQSLSTHPAIRGI